MGARAPISKTSLPGMWLPKGSKALLIQHDRHRAVVDELDLHPRAENAGRHLDPERPQLGAVALVERLGDLRAGGAGEARAVAAARVREQRELADDERCAAGVEERAVEAARFVGEDPQLPRLAREPHRRGLVVAL